MSEYATITGLRFGLGTAANAERVGAEIRAAIASTNRILVDFSENAGRCAADEGNNVRARLAAITRTGKEAAHAFLAGTASVGIIGLTTHEMRVFDDAFRLAAEGVPITTDGVPV